MNADVTHSCLYSSSCLYVQAGHWCLGWLLQRLPGSHQGEGELMQEGVQSQFVQWRCTSACARACICSQNYCPVSACDVVRGGCLYMLFPLFTSKADMYTPRCTKWSMLWVIPYCQTHECSWLIMSYNLFWSLANPVWDALLCSVCKPWVGL